MKLALAAVLLASVVTTDAVAPGAEGVGDRLFPLLGNGGYDAKSYDVSFDFRPGTTEMASEVTMTASATQALSRFNLDSVGERIAEVTVNGEQARFSTHDEELVITPRRPIRKGQVFTTKVRYTADRKQEPPSQAFPPIPDLPEVKIRNWVETPDGFALFGQPDRAHLFFPSNDHPSDKATFTFRVTVPNGLTAVANGQLTQQRTQGDRTTFVYETRHPMATHVSQVAVGKFAILQGRVDGVPLRSAVPSGEVDAMRPFVDATANQVKAMQTAINRPFPFEGYGVLGLHSDYNGVALESQTLSTFSTAVVGAPEEAAVVQMHELAHHYFGNSVSVRSWEDMWLSEGHAHFYEGPQDVRAIYERDQESRTAHGPAGRPNKASDIMFFTNEPGSLVLFALKAKVGDETFRRIEESFLDRFRDRSASTQDYIDTVNRVTGSDLTPFMREWLFGAKTPPMPGWS